MGDGFQLKSEFQPTGDQPGAIDQLCEGVDSGKRAQVLLGATGTGKTFTMANVIAQTGRPALVLAHRGFASPHMPTVTFLVKPILSEFIST